MKRRAFTLIETILAISLSAIIMLACADLIFNLVKTSSTFESAWTLKAHADGVEKFLRKSFMNSSISDISKIPGIIFKRNTNSLCVAKLPEEENANNYFLVFSTKEPHPLYISATEVSPEKYCFLQFVEDEGLYIVWKFLVAEDRDKEPIIYRTLLSKHVKEVSYIYKDSTLWKDEKELDTSMTEMPKFIKVVFGDKTETITRIISLNSQLDFQIAR